MASHSRSVGLDLARMRDTTNLPIFQLRAETRRHIHGSGHYTQQKPKMLYMKTEAVKTARANIYNRPEQRADR